MTEPTTPLIGIDLGTTNSVVAAYQGGQVRVLEESGTALLPSVVGVTPEGKLVVGEVARNQLTAFPERTIASVKRRMGESVQLTMGDRTYTPQEISAVILRRLRERAESALGGPVNRAVITVPAFFDEHQRQATREAGELAGLTVERIINEPTAASLVYGADQDGPRHYVVYDLGGGTFDVSIVRTESGVIEVLSSKGDTHLGGDDFDQLLSKFVADAFHSLHGVDLNADVRTRWRLLQACERAKCELSTLESTRVIEALIAEHDGRPLHLDLTISRADYERLIAPLVERTIDCVDQALADAAVTLSTIDDVLLVGGSTRTPLVQNRLRQELGREPRWGVNPDLAVALGAGTQAAMQSGQKVGPVLVDVATHTLGIAALEDQFGHQPMFSPIIHRNSPLPACHEQAFHTVFEGQEDAEIEVFQGESRVLGHNRAIGKFMLQGLNQSTTADGRIVVRFDLTLDGTLKVSAREVGSSVAHSLVIQGANARLDSAARAAAAEHLESMFAASDEFDSAGEFSRRDGSASQPASHWTAPDAESSRLDALLVKARAAQNQATPADREEIEQLIESIELARQQADDSMLSALEVELDDLLYYVVG